jgi:hypothetical protein
MCPIPSNQLARFTMDAESRLDWFKSELALLSPASPDYESEKRAIQAASEELRKLIRHVTAARRD